MSELVPWCPAVVEGALERTELREGWQVCVVAPGLANTPGALEALAGLTWHDACVPGPLPVAVGRDVDVDRVDVWYRTTVEVPPHEGSPGARTVLEFPGLATLAEVWLDEALVLASDNMFVGHAVAIPEGMQGPLRLFVRCRSLQEALRSRRAHARWKTRLVRDGGLRWVRTSLLGRLAAPIGAQGVVGPCGPVALVRHTTFRVGALAVSSALTVDAQGRRVSPLAGEISVRATLEGLGGAPSMREGLAAALRVRCPRTGRTWAGEARVEACVASSSGQGVWKLDATVSAREIEAWWPHTHGEPTLYALSLEVQCSGEVFRVDLGHTGFRELRTRTDDPARFGLEVNGERVFCRGVCWTSAAPETLHPTEPQLRETLLRLRDAGANMVRVGGTTTYEDEAFYRLCDELGLMVWQDLMFANLDYPFDDADFARSVEREVTQVLTRLAPRPCLAVVCGGSEVMQQAAMMGRALEPGLFTAYEHTFRELAARYVPRVPYVPNTPWSGMPNEAVPFRTGAGIAHAFGVGAYLRPELEARAYPPAFAAECLAFSLPPADRLLERLFGDDKVVSHDPRYKRGVPRDPGAGWDFADVTDHYVAAAFSIDVLRLRYEDPVRYLALARLATGELMGRVMSTWRGADTACAGALVWHGRDLVAGAGWGILDVSGQPKAAYFYLRRAWQPRALWLSDRGLEGLFAVVVNDRAAAFVGTLEVVGLRGGQTVVFEAKRALEIAGRSERQLDLEGEVVGRFSDLTHAYRFGPAVVDQVVARFVPSDAREGEPLEAWWEPRPCALGSSSAPSLSAEAKAESDGSFILEVSSDRFVRALAIVVPGYTPSDDAFGLAQGRARRVRLVPQVHGARFAGYVHAVVEGSSQRIVVIG